mmetsp:Transcript_79003/g.198539  ORF Transcript_79003/g.198539 Transcript_79003/m.198539 type:complete len:204 (-) Transcript_79003:407-1018(-)
MAWECIQVVVHTKPQLEARIDQHSADCAHRDGPHRGDEAGRRGDDNEAHNSSSHHARGRGGAPVLKPFQQGPYDQARSCGLVGVHERQNSGVIRSQGRSAVEARPPEPEQGSPKDGERDIVRLLLLHPSATVQARAKQPGQHKRRHRGGLMHDNTASKILRAELINPAPWSPGPVADWGVDKHRPQASEAHVGAESHAFHNSS